MSLAAIPAEALDGGWPDSTEECAWVGMDAVLTGIPADMADSRIALLCDRFLDSLVLFVDQSTPLAAVSRRLDFLAGMTHGSICLVFIEQCQGHSERLPSQDLREMKIEESVGAI